MRAGYVRKFLPQCFPSQCLVYHTSNVVQPPCPDLYKGCRLVISKNNEAVTLVRSKDTEVCAKVGHMLMQSFHCSSASQCLVYHTSNVVQPPCPDLYKGCRLVISQKHEALTLVRSKDTAVSTKEWHQWWRNLPTVLKVSLLGEK
jgi:hypothetical protein